MTGYFETSLRRCRDAAQGKIGAGELSRIDLNRILLDYDHQRSLVEKWAPIVGQLDALASLDLLFVDRKKHDARVTELLKANTSLVLQLREARSASSETMALIERLVKPEGDAVKILSEDPERPANHAIVVNAGWTDHWDTRFEGDTLRNCLILALATRDAPHADPCPGHVASDDNSKVCRFCGTHVDDERPD